jgi:hypothetical protein
MSSQIYQIVFNGEIAADCDIDIVKGNLVDLFKADMPAINRIFCGQPVVIKRNLDPEGALVYTVRHYSGGGRSSDRDYAGSAGRKCHLGTPQSRAP